MWGNGTNNIKEIGSKCRFPAGEFYSGYTKLCKDTDQFGDLLFRHLDVGIVS